MNNLFFFFLCGLVIVTACTSGPTGQVIIDQNIDVEKLGASFKATANEICLKDGKPIVREFATSWCPHCSWVKETYQSVVQEYGKAGKIIAYQWEVDTKDDLLTEALEFAVPEAEMNIFKKFSPDGAIPTFVIGCKYYRVGNAYESQNNKEAEAQELRFMIDKTLGEVQSP